VAGNSRTPGRSVISKASAILLTLAEDGQCTLTEVAGRLDLPLSTVHRLATELAAWRVLERTEDGRYRAGRPLRAMSGACSCTCDAAGLRERAAPVVEDLFRVTGSRVRVGYLDGPAVAYIEKSAAHLPVTALCPAARLPAHATALGKALLAFTSPQSTAAVLSGPLRQYTPQTITSAERLRWSLRTIRATRLAVCDRELDPGASAVAMPVFGLRGQVAAAVEVTVADVSRNVLAVKPALAMAAGALTRELEREEGVGPPPTGAAASGDFP
jgi:DNA-binding IclR family transcriptional regulator